VPLRITKVERLVVFATIPAYREIVGWRVMNVESELTGTGVPTKKLELNKIVAVLKWDRFPNEYLSRDCACNLVEVERGSEVTEFFVFEME
jgi:hypothetical protein